MAKPCAAPTSAAATAGSVSRVWVSVLDQASGVVLGQVQEKGSEITAFITLLDQLDLADVLVTADALHTQRV